MSESSNTFKSSQLGQIRQPQSKAGHPFFRQKIGLYSVVLEALFNFPTIFGAAAAENGHRF